MYLVECESDEFCAVTYRDVSEFVIIRNVRFVDKTRNTKQTLAKFDDGEIMLW
jgi:hypothetical protein